MISFIRHLHVVTIILMIVMFLCLPFTEAEELSEEGIFIEAISEMNNGRLTLDEVRTRPTAVNSLGKSFLIEVDGYYIAGDGPEESRHIAEDRARADAKRAASEQASVYVKTISQSKKGKLTRDEIQTISAIVLQIKNEVMTVEIVEGNTAQYHCHMEAMLSDASISEQVSATDKEKFHESVRRTIEIERESARLNAELVALKEKYKTASTAEREKINIEVKHNEEQFAAVQWNEKGYIANYQMDFDKAVEYCYKAVELDPKYSSAWNNLGYAYSYKGSFDRAIECYKKAIELNPEDVTPLINLGNAYNELKNLDEAVKFYQSALEIDPNHSDTWNSLGYTYIQKGDYDKGIEYCQKAVDIDKNYASALNGLAYAYNQKKKFYKAIEYCRKAIAINKNYANAWNNLGYACSKVSRYEDSYAAYERAVKIAPNVHLYRKNFEIAQKRIYSFKSL